MTLHARVTEETPALAVMPPEAYFINAACGPMVDYAALETFAVEPMPPDLELLKSERVTLTPHIAGASLTSVERAAEAIAEEIRRYLVKEQYTYEPAITTTVRR